MKAEKINWILTSCCGNTAKEKGLFKWTVWRVYTSILHGVIVNILLDEQNIAIFSICATTQEKSEYSQYLKEKLTKLLLQTMGQQSKFCCWTKTHEYIVADIIDHYVHANKHLIAWGLEASEWLTSLHFTNFQHYAEKRFVGLTEEVEDTSLHEVVTTTTTT